MFLYDATLEVPKQIFAQLVARMQNTEVPQIKIEDLLRICAAHDIDEKVQLYSDISVLEVILLIAIKHHTEIYDRDPFNFEMILTRCRKFQNSTQSRMEIVERPIALRSFEHLNVRTETSTFDYYFLIPFCVILDAGNICANQHNGS